MSDEKPEEKTEQIQLNSLEMKLVPAIPQRPFDSSAKTGKLFMSLSKAQGAMESAKKDSENTFFSNGNRKAKYADLAACWDAVREPLAKNELAVIQLNQIGETFKVTGQKWHKESKKMLPFSVEGKTVKVLTILTHGSDEWISCMTELQPTKTDPQGMGSAMTYARRYGLMAITGIAPDDDDGNAASGNTQDGGDNFNYNQDPSYNQENPFPPQGSQTETKKVPKSEKTVTQKQLKRMQTIAGQTNWGKTELKKLCVGMFKLDSSKKLNMEQYEKMVEIIEKNNPEEFFQVMEGEAERSAIEEEGKSG